MGSILGTLSVADDWVPWELGKPFSVSWQGETPSEELLSEMEERIQKKMAAMTQEFFEEGIAECFERLNRSKELDDLYHPLRPVAVS